MRSSNPGLPRGWAPERLRGDWRFGEDARPMVDITVTDRDGGVHRVDAREGVSLMETLRELEYGVAAICGGMCSCATCHVYVDADWRDRLPEPQSDERELVSELLHRRESSRLSCQVSLSDALDGLRVTVAPEE